MEKQKTKHNQNHKYMVGDVVNGIIITELCYAKDKDGHNKKAYKYLCPICGYDCGEYYKKGMYHIEHMVFENNLSHGAGCVVCSKNGFVIPNINSIHALNPECEKLLKYKDDALKYAPQSSQKLECVCPDCGKEYLRSCAKIVNYGVPCVCGDGFSYPEKFIFNALQQLNVSFKPQYYLSGSIFRYDFYLIDYNIILEVNGIQHYKQKWDRDEVENDAKKKEFAFSCGFTDDNYIVLDCRESNLKFIKESVLNSKLNCIFDCSSIDFVQCAEFASSNLIAEASKLWNSGKNIQEISQEMLLDKHTIIAYLKQGDDIGWCAYQVGDGTQLYHQRRMKNAVKSSGVVGVSWDKRTKKWKARIGVSGSRIELGRFNDLSDAIFARKEAERKYLNKQ